MRKSDENKKIKEEKMLKTAFNLFTKKGFKETSIQDIVDNAGKPVNGAEEGFTH